MSSYCFRNSASTYRILLGLALLFLLAPSVSRVYAASSLRVNPSNPRYFFDGDGRAVYLAGSYQNPYNLLSSGTQDYSAYFDFLAQQNHNFTRVWAWEQSPWTYDQNGEVVFTQQPYERTGPGTALDGGLKFDITRFNQAYFDQLRERIVAAGQRGIYVSLILFEGFSTQRQVRQVNPWLGDPFQSENNINSIDADSNRDGRGVEFFTLDSPSVTALQEAFVRKVADTLNDLDNVLYEISGDTLPSSLAWQTHMVDYLKAYEATKPNQHPVGISQFYPKGIAEVFNSSADWIVMQGTNLKPALAGGSKVLFLEASSALLRKNSDQWVWKTFTRGYNPIYPEDSSVSSNVHAAIGQTKAYSQLLNMSSMSPSDTACSNKFCLLSPTGDYLVYLPSRGAVTIDLSAATQGVIAAWFDPATGQTIPETSASGSKQVRFTSPVGGQSVLQVIANGGTLARPMGTSDIESWSKSVITATSPNYTTTQALTSARSALQDNTVATPTITPNGGIYSGSVKVTLTTPTSGASIYYTTDGQTPTETSQKYKRAFTLTSSTLVKAIALKTNMNPSAQASAWFSNSGASGSIVAMPTITPNGGSFTSSVSITIASATSGASIYYTTNGSSPTQSSTLYTGAFTLNSSATIKAKAFMSGYNPSAEASASFTQSTNTSNSGLVGYWNFDEGTGTVAADSSGNGNHGTLINGPQWATGIAGKALYFDGIDDNIVVPDSNTLDLSNSFTLSAWVNPSSTFTSWISILAKNYRYYLYASGIGFCGTGNPMGGFNEAQDIVACGPSPLPTNTWTHMTVTYDGSALTLYQNGVAVAVYNVSTALSPTTGTLQIGASEYGEYFQGIIDEVRIYNRALSSTEIQAVHQQIAASLPFDYSISNSGNRSVSAGSSIGNTISAALMGGVSQPISFGVSGLPSGASASFSSASCTPTCSTVINISTSGSTPAGDYAITVTSSGGGVKKTTTFTLSVAFALTVATPTITPNGGSFSDSISVTLQSATSGSSIYYTTDGSTPTQASNLYAGTMTLTNNATVNAKAFKSGYNPSTVAAASFTNSLSRTTGTGTIYYIATSGSDAYSCAQAQSQSTPKLTLNSVFSCMASGDTVQIKAGTYATPTTMPPSGTSWSSPTTIQRYGSEVVTLAASGDQPILLDNKSYTVWDGIRFQGAGPSVTDKIVFFWNGSHHNRFINSQFSGARTAFVDGYSQPSGGYNEIIRNTIRTGNYNPSSLLAPAIYLESRNNLIEGNDISQTKGYCMQLYTGSQTLRTDNTIVRYNWCHDSTYDPGKYGGSGLNLASGDNLQVYGNIFSNNGGPSDGGDGVISVSDATNFKIYNNTFHRNQSISINAKQSSSHGYVRNNVLWQNCQASGSCDWPNTEIYNAGSNTTLSNNLCTSNASGCTLVSNPAFRDPAANNFRLQSGSPAIDTGANLLSEGVNYDFDGVSRPKGTTFDMGAFEYTP